MNSPQRAVRSTVRDQLANLNNPPRVLMDPKDLPLQTLFWRVLLEPFVPRHNGLIETPDMVKQAEEITGSVGRILQLGSMAFKSRTNAGLCLADEPHMPKVGDYVKHHMYAGEVISLKKGDQKVRVLNDTDILAIVTDPEQIRGYL